MQAAEIVLVMFRGIQGNDGNKLRELQVYAVELIDGHFVGFESNGLEALLEVAHHEGLVEFFLLGETRGVQGFELSEPLLVVLGVL